MNIDLLTEWADALVSGKYVQVQDRLHEAPGPDGLERCCVLGVLNDISKIGRWTDEHAYTLDLQGLDRVAEREVFEALVADHLMFDFWGDRVSDLAESPPEDTPTKVVLAAETFLDRPDNADTWAPSFAEYVAWPPELRAMFADCLVAEEEGAHPLVAKAVGFTGSQGPTLRVIHEGEECQFSLLALNDMGYSFDDLARLIREQLIEPARQAQGRVP
jgi:hypothetical protein